MRRRSFNHFAMAVWLCYVENSAVGKTLDFDGDDEFFELLSKSKFNQIPLLFYYPEEYTEEDKISDAGGIEEFFANFSFLAGNLSARRSGKLEGTFLSVAIMASDIQYWVNRQNSDEPVRRSYLVDTKRGILGLSLNWLKQNNSWKIRNFECNIPANQPGVHEFALSLAKPALRRLEKREHSQKDS